MGGTAGEAAELVSAGLSIAAAAASRSWDALEAATWRPLQEGNPNFQAKSNLTPPCWGCGLPITRAVLIRTNRPPTRQEAPKMRE